MPLFSTCQDLDFYLRWNTHTFRHSKSSKGFIQGILDIFPRLQKRRKAGLSGLIRLNFGINPEKGRPGRIWKKEGILSVGRDQNMLSNPEASRPMKMIFGLKLPN